MLDSHDDFEGLYDGAPDLLYAHDLEWRLIRVNRAFEQVTGYTRNIALGTSFLDFVAPEHRSKLIEGTEEQRRGARPHPLEIDLLTSTGSRVMLEITTELIFEKGQLVGVQGFGRDITERKRGAAAIAELTEKASDMTAFNSHLLLLHRLSTTPYTHLASLFSEYLAAGCEIFSMPHAAIWQATSDGLVLRAAHGQGAVVEDPAAAIVVENKSTIINDGTDNRCRSALYVGAPLFLDDRLFGSVGFWSHVPGRLRPHAREIVELMAQGIATALHHIHMGQQLAVSATQDPLTRVANKLLFSQRLEIALADARDRGSMVAIIFIDLDRLKRINEGFGRNVGNAFLEHMAARLQAHMRLGDTLARMGGDEFAAILPGMGEHAQVLAMVHRLLDAVRTPCRIGENELSVSASIGVSVYPRDGVDADTLLRNATAAMYAAERRGSDNVQLYSTEDTKTAVARLTIATSLRRALERNEFRLFFQPQVDFRGQIAGAEVLLSWLHPELGRVPAGEFIPIAEQTGMILPIGNWVLREACRQATEWLGTGSIRLRTAVNVSAVQFAQAGFVDFVAAVLNETGLPPEFLELEITESLLLRDMQQVAKSLGTLRSLGIRIAIDDFGTGYSSLKYIRHLPVDALKIDRSFVIGFENDNATLGLLSAIVALGHTLGLTVTAEGVETRSQLHLVRMAGCDLAQGHLFGVALDAQTMGALLMKRQPLFAAQIASAEEPLQKGTRPPR
ncbi:MAG TPA: EAL domain-containing protein [Terriglobia bacterium]|nr:EAL domain-containing protein [Terriglobia bacterium]